MDYLHDGRVIVSYEMPLIEVIVDFFDLLKSRTKGYASLDYEVIGYRPGDLVKLEIMLNAEPIDALSFIVARDKAANRGRTACGKSSRSSSRARCSTYRSRAAIGGKIVARENRQRHSQKRARQMLRRRYYPEAQASRKTESRQRAYETRRPSRPTAGGVHGCPPAQGVT